MRLFDVLTVVKNISSEQKESLNAGQISMIIFMWLAVILTIVLLIPAVYDVYKTRNTVSISKWMYLLYPFCSTAWVIYACLMVVDNVPWYEIVGIGVCEAISFCFALYILIIKLKNQNKAKQMHVSEAEWYRAYIKEKNTKDKFKKIGILNENDLNENKNQRKKLIDVLLGLKSKYPDIVDKRVSNSKTYNKSLQGNIKSPKKRLEHFLNVATNARISQIISLIYFDIYNLTTKK